MNRTRKFFANVFFSALLSLTTMIAGFILPKTMLVNYGSEVNGLVSSITQFVGYFTIVEAGLAAAAIFSLYKPLAEKNQKEINDVVSTTKQFYYKSGLVFLFLISILALVYPLIVKTSVLQKIDIVFLIFIIGATGVLDFFTLAKYRTLLTADQKLYVISIASIVGVIINTFIIVLLSNIKFNIVLVRLIALIAILIRSSILIIYVKKKYPKISFNERPRKDLLNKRWDALYLQILGSFQNGAPYILLSTFSTLINVSIYSIYNMIMMGVNNLLSIFISGLSSSFGEIIAKKDTSTLQKAYDEFEYIYYNLLTITYSLTFILILPFIKVYTIGITDANYIILEVAILFVLNGLFYNTKTPQGMLIHSAGFYKETKIQTTIQASIIVVLGIILTPKLGVSGVLIASIVSNVYRTIDLIYFVPKYITKMDRKKTISRLIKITILGILIILTGKSLIGEINNYVSWLINSIKMILMSITFILLFDYLFERKMLKAFLLRVKMLFKRKKI